MGGKLEAALSAPDLSVTATATANRACRLARKLQVADNSSKHARSMRGNPRASEICQINARNPEIAGEACAFLACPGIQVKISVLRQRRRPAHFVGLGGGQSGPNCRSFNGMKVPKSQRRIHSMVGSYAAAKRL